MRTIASLVVLGTITPALAWGEGYTDSRVDLERQRARLARRLKTGESRAVVLTNAEGALLEAVRGGLLESWLGTPWDFNGMSEEPGQGQIACGYLVSTVLRDAGFRVERIRLAQQAAEWIVMTLSDEPDIQRFSDAPAGEVLDAVATRGDGIYIVGLDFHVGFLIRQSDHTEFCHSSYLGEAEVVCSDPAQDPAFASRYRIVGKVGPKAIERWLLRRGFPTWRGK